MSSIYNILNKLNGLLPKEEPKQTLPESAKPKTKLEEAIAQVEEKYMGFKKVAAAAKAGGAEDPEAVAASIGRKKYGKEKFQKAAAAGKKMGEAAKPDFLDVDDDGNKKETFKKAVKDKKVTEAAAPGQEDWIKSNKARFIKQYGKKKGMEVLYATAWKRSKQDESADQEDRSAKDPAFEGRDEDDYWDFKDLKDEPKSRTIKVAGTRYGGAAQRDDDEGEETVAADQPKRGRGRPKGTGKKMGAKGPTGKSKLMRESTEMINESLEHIIHSYPHEVRKLVQTGDFDNDLYSALFDYYFNSGEMPYGVAKARDGDPYEWMYQRFMDDTNDGEGLVEDGPATRDIPAYMRKAAGKDFPLTKDQAAPTEKFLWVVPTAGSRDFEPKAFPNTSAGKMAADEYAGGVLGKVVLAAEAPLEEDYTLEAKLSELAKLAGLEMEGNEFSGALAKAKAAGAKEFNVDGKKYPVKESIEITECGEMEGERPEGNLNVSTTFNSQDGNQTLSVNADGEVAEHLLSLLKLSGLIRTKDDADKVRAQMAPAQEPEVVVVGEAAKKYGDTDVDNLDDEYDNTPKEKIFKKEVITKTGGDLNREKKQYAGKPKLGDNPMAESALGANLMKEYESIKIKK